MSERLEPPKKPLGPSTMAVHGGEPRLKPAHALTTPIVQTATYAWASSQEVKDYFDGKIDEVAVYLTALSPARVNSARGSSTFPP